MSKNWFDSENAGCVGAGVGLAIAPIISSLFSLEIQEVEKQLLTQARRDPWITAMRRLPDAALEMFGRKPQSAPFVPFGLCSAELTSLYAPPGDSMLRGTPCPPKMQADIERLRTSHSKLVEPN